MTDTTDAPLSRPPALFFFQQGYLAAGARFGSPTLTYESVAAAGASDWNSARNVHPDPALFDRYLHRADSADQQLRDSEAAFRAHFAADRETTGSREELATCAENLRRFGAELFPTNRTGQAHFARVIMDTVANTIDAALALPSAAVEEREAQQLRDRVTHDDQFQAACQRYAHDGGSSAAIAAAAILALQPSAAKVEGRA